MFTRDELNKIMDEIRKNNEVLDRCPAPFHEFTIVHQTQRAKRICKHCKGSIDVGDAHWYAKGVEHGRADQQNRDADPGLAGPGEQHGPDGKSRPAGAG